MALLLLLLRYPHTTAHSEIPTNLRAEEYPFPREKSRLFTGMPLGFANMTGGARYPPRLTSFSPFR